MSFDQILNIFNYFSINLLAKVLILVVGLFYFVFTIIVYRQITLMAQTLDSGISPTIKTMAIIQIATAGFLFFLALFLA